MFVVNRCMQDFEEVFRVRVAEFETEQEAEDFAQEADKCHPFADVWHEVTVSGG